QEASALYLGDYLPDDLYEEWAGERRDELRRKWTELQYDLAQALEDRADASGALAPLERVLLSDPRDERAAREQMKLLARHGRRRDALRVYQNLVQALRENLDVAPSIESVALHRKLTAGDIVSALPQAAPSFHCAYPFPAPSQFVGRQAEL